MSDTPAFRYVVKEQFDGHEVGSILSADDLKWSHGEGEGEESFAHRVGTHLIRVAVDAAPVAPQGV